jgi:uncharacterized protein YkwD
MKTCCADPARTLRLLVVVVLFTVTIGLTPTPVGPTSASAATASAARIDGVLLTGFEARLVRLVNRARTSRGLARAKVTPCAEDFARKWTKVMARQNRLYHNPNFRRLWSDPWCDRATWVAENVGVSSGPGAARAVFRAYMRSAAHRRNILNRRARFIGIGAVTRSGGRTYNTMNFANRASANYGGVKVLGQYLGRT